MASILTKRVLNRNLIKFRDYSVLSMCQNSIFSNVQTHKHPTQVFIKASSISIKHYSNKATDHDKNCCPKKDNEEVKLTLFQRFKQMYRDYWYVLVPVHLVTSAAWFGGFYYLAKSGVDIPALLESMNVSESITKPLKDSKMGYIAVSYGLYKIATPARYTVTLGGTTVSINYLKKWGYIKPVPSKDTLKKIYHDSKDNIIENVFVKKDNIIESVKEKQAELTNQKEGILRGVNKSIQKMKGHSFKKNN